jgi:OOP family OmpA-OmpF porin
MAKRKMAKRKKVSNRLQQIGGSESRKTPPPMPGRPSDTQLVELGMFISATLFGTVILAVLAVIFGVKAIENRLETEAMNVINAQVAAASEEDPSVATRTDVSVDATATDLRIRGTVGIEDHKLLFPEMVERLEGVAGVTAELEYLAPISVDILDVVAAPLTVTWGEGSAEIVGEVSSDGNRQLLVGTLEDLFPEKVDADRLVVVDDVPSERDWLSSAVGIIEIGGSGLDEGRVLINAAERLIQVSGEFETRQERSDAEESVQALIDATTFDFISGMSIPEQPAFTQEDVEELQESIDDLIEGKVVEFELNSDQLTPVGTALLDEILAALEQFPNVPIEIAGHTDNQGEDAANLDLSERRAQAALDYFVSNGQDPARFVVQGYGEEVPVASNDTADGRARNRRIEFKALEE